MTYMQQRRTYRAEYDALTDQQLQARFDAMTPEEQQALLASVTSDTPPQSQDKDSIEP